MRNRPSSSSTENPDPRTCDRDCRVASDQPHSCEHSSIEARSDSTLQVLRSDAYHSAYQFEPWNEEWLRDATYAEIQANQLTRAEYDIAQLAAIRPLSSEELIWLGQIYAGQGRQTEAFQLWDGLRASEEYNRDVLDSTWLNICATT